MGSLIVQNAFRRTSDLTFLGNLKFDVLQDTLQQTPRNIPCYIIIDFSRHIFTLAELQETKNTIIRGLQFIGANQYPHVLVVISGNPEFAKLAEKVLQKGASLSVFPTMAEFEAVLDKNLTVKQTSSLEASTFDFRDQLRLKLVQMQANEIIPFPPKGNLILKSISTGKSIKTSITDELFIGRKTSDAYHIDVDLTPWRGYQFGVSRQHARFDLTADRVLKVIDLASANGTFVRGIKLMPYVPFEVTHLDVICLGYLLIEICFEAQHTSDELPGNPPGA